MQAVSWCPGQGDGAVLVRGGTLAESQFSLPGGGVTPNLVTLCVVFLCMGQGALGVAARGGRAVHGTSSCAWSPGTCRFRSADSRGACPAPLQGARSTARGPSGPRHQPRRVHAACSSLSGLCSTQWDGRDFESGTRADGAPARKRQKRRRGRGWVDSVGWVQRDDTVVRNRGLHSIPGIKKP